MKELLKKWRYYSLSAEDYKKCMNKIFYDNLFNLRQANIVVAILAACFAIFPILVEQKYFKAFIYLGSAFIAMLMSISVDIKHKRRNEKRQAGNKFIYTMIVLYYTNVILFGIYLGVFANPGKLAVSFMGILICALILFNLPSFLNLCLTLGALALFITASVIEKSLQDWSLDVVNALFAGFIGLFMCWKITVYRLTLAATAIKLENETTVDPLTQLKNRRDFMQTIQRCLSNYRKSDDLLCLGILDIDKFKNYNDFYGHPKGDECLKTISKALVNLKENMGIYAARIGGEEFALIWFEQDSSKVYIAASKINQMIRDLNIPHEKSDVAPYVTISMGIHIAKCGAFTDVQALYDLADKALYTAKLGGRDRYVITV